MARRVKIATRPLRIVERDAITGNVVHYTADDELDCGSVDSLSRGVVADWFKHNDLCFTGGAVALAQSTGMLHELAPFVKVCSCVSRVCLHCVCAVFVL